MTSAAARRALEAFCSPSAAMTYEKRPRFKPFLTKLLEDDAKKSGILSHLAEYMR